LKLSDGSSDFKISNAKPQNPDLPKLKLLTFDGDQLIWKNFRGLFKLLLHVDVDKIMSVMKMQYFKANFKDEVAIIGKIKLNAAAYTIIWE